jgi:hypothetical protein
LRPVLDLPAQASGQARGNLLIATDDVVALIAGAEGRECRTTVRVDEEQKVLCAADY